MDIDVFISGFVCLIGRNGGWHPIGGTQHQSARSPSKAHLSCYPLGYMGCLLDRQWRTATDIARLCLLLLAAASTAQAQISPGELTSAHSALNGPGHCTDCHDAGKRPPEFRCLSCHRDIRERLAANTGLHPSLVGSDRSGRNCAQCHNEHNGKNFNLIHWSVPVQNFDHAKTGYLLEGRHSSVACRTCHQASHIPMMNRANISVKNLARTYLGLSRRCAECHTDVHRGQLSSDCENCHDPQDWKKPTRFDHSRARFGIEGAHEKVPCSRCHIPSDRTSAALQYRNLPFEDCTPCHSDPHSGSFRNPCRTCHTLRETTWMPANESTAFNHSRTRFPLLGKHARLTCKSCHAGGNFGKPIAFAKCSDCHKTDPHNGQFTSAPALHDCDFCHTVSGFKPSTFRVAEHNATAFPLKDRHVETPCGKCHVLEASGAVIYRIRDFSCVACHRDIHDSQFAGPPYKNNCESCHSEKEFKPSAFTTARHDATRFSLAGGHVKAACVDCHKPGGRPVQFRFEDRSCTVCHTDPHRSAISAQTTLPLYGSAAKDSCQACHSVNTWQEIAKFDHSQTGFSLDGAHQKVDCAKCHQPSGTAGNRSVVFTNAPKQCTGCHEDPHAGQFVSRMAAGSPNGNPRGCAACHTATSWHELSGFDHSSTKFPLQGAHKTVACAKCHKPENPEAGIRSVNYQNTSIVCAACHDDAHGGQFDSGKEPDDCSRCHQVQKWAPSNFDHDTQSSYRLTGAHRHVDCRLCHSATRDVAGKKIIVYKGTARDCSACHQSNNTGNRP